ncbi:UNVERIFIED_CONTAM: hypothetical protein GTU68_036772 [Idotea baltica]|nr:hypothetical protein [Idotea baltica]
MVTLQPLVLTSGEPAGIGPDLCLQVATRKRPYPLIVIANKELLSQRAKLLNLSIQLHDITLNNLPLKPANENSLYILDIPLNQTVIPGKLNKHNANYVLNMLQKACIGCCQNNFSAVVTAPIHKGIINQAGISFSGHTEFFAENSNTNDVVMMLTTKGLRVALATTHLPLKSVADQITLTHLTRIIRILHNDLRTKFLIFNPRILICGLNPHAGEQGYLGLEEKNIIEPVLHKLRTEGMDLIGPVPADTAFTPNNIAQSDAVLAMYHDQGLPVLKHKGFGAAINITLGLPFIRTSVDHGTALCLAGTGKAEVNSLEIALDTAYELASQHQIKSI